MSDRETYNPPEGAPTAIVIDVDGTLALRVTDRRFYDWHRVDEDVPHPPIVELVRALRAHTTAELIFVSGRSDICRDLTTRWLIKTLGWDFVASGLLFMRKHGDGRDDTIVKREIFDEHIRNSFHVLYVIDDRAKVVKMWRSLGLTVLDVADGQF